MKARAAKRSKPAPVPVSKHRVARTPLPKTPTGIEGLDAVLAGGIPAGRATLVSGGPGSGKSLLGLEFLYQGILRGEPGVLVAFEESADAIRRNALTMGWDLAAFERANRLRLIEAALSPEVVLSGDFGLSGLTAMIAGRAKAVGATRIVIDAVDVVLRMLGDPVREGQELRGLHAWLLNQGMTAILTMRSTAREGPSSRYEFLDFMIDCMIQLDQRASDRRSTRHLRVVKYRGSDFGSNEHPYVLTDHGMALVPVPTAGLKHKPLGPRVSTGHPGLDAVMHGGYRRGACVLVAGASGTGKTTLANTFVRAACQRRERVLYIGFEESSEAMVDAMLGPGIDLRPALRHGHLQFDTALPEAMGSEEHLIRALRAVDAFTPDHIVIDAVSACQRMGTRRAPLDYLLRLMTVCKERCITCLMMYQTTGLQGASEVAGIGVSSAVDTVLLLRYFETGAAISRTLLVMKSRGSGHSNQFRRFVIGDRGIEIEDVRMGAQEDLTGVVGRAEGARDAADPRRREHEIARLEHEIARKRAAIKAQTVALRGELDMVEAELEMLQDDRLAPNASRSHPPAMPTDERESR